MSTDAQNLNLLAAFGNASGDEVKRIERSVKYLELEDNQRGEGKVSQQDRHG